MQHTLRGTHRSILVPPWSRAGNTLSSNSGSVGEEITLDDAAFAQDADDAGRIFVWFRGAWRETDRRPARSALRNTAPVLASPRAVAVFIYKADGGGYDVNTAADCKWNGLPAGAVIGQEHVTKLADANKIARYKVKHYLSLGTKTVLVVDVNDNHRKYTQKRPRGFDA